jgi:FkbM family methyltransferase
LFNLVREFVAPASVVWDVGANVGLFAFAAAQRAGQAGVVVAVEPDPFLVQLLRRSCRIQPRGSAPVRVIPGAVAASVGIRTFNLASQSRQANFLTGYGTTQARGPVEEQMVLTVTLDALAEHFPLPDVLKIDVEGAELEVLRGARSLLERKRPVILCEVGSAASADVAALLVSLGYRLVDGEVPIERREPLRTAPWCTVALPA